MTNPKPPHYDTPLSHMKLKKDTPLNDKKHEPKEAGTPAPPAASETAKPAEPAPAAEPTPTDALQALNDRLLRLQADFDNFRKRTLREKGEISKRANEEIMTELLSVLDHLDMALAAAAEHATEGPVAAGFKMVSDQLLGVLVRFGLRPVDVQGQAFDTSLHEAVAHIPSAVVPENGVITQIRRGYALGEKLLRPAQVVISSGSPSPAPVAPAEDDAKPDEPETDQ